MCFKVPCRQETRVSGAILGCARAKPLFICGAHAHARLRSSSSQRGFASVGDTGQGFAPETAMTSRFRFRNQPNRRASSLTSMLIRALQPARFGRAAETHPCPTYLTPTHFHALTLTHAPLLFSSLLDQIIREDAAAAPGDRPAAHRSSGPPLCGHDSQRECNMCSPKPSRLARARGVLVR